MILPYPFGNLQGMRMRSKVPFVNDRNTYYPEGTIFEVAGVGTGVELRPEGKMTLIPVDHVSLFALLDPIDEGGNRVYLSRIFDTLANVDPTVWKKIQEKTSREKPLDVLKDIRDGKIQLDKKAMDSNQLVACYGIKELRQKLKDISAWCSIAFGKHGLGENKHIVILVDKWDPEKFDSCFAPYKEEFRRRAMHEDFWFFFVWADGNDYHEIPFLPIDLYDFTRHPAS